MAQDAERVDGLPSVASPDASGSYSPCSNVHLKHEYSLCTTQAPLAAITDISSSLNGAYSPATLPPEAHETRRSEAVTTSSHDQSDGTGRPERGGSSPTSRHPGPGPYSQYGEYSPEDLSPRMQEFHADRPTDFDGYSLNIVSKPVADSVSTSRPGLVYSVNNPVDGLPSYDLDVQTQQGEEWAVWDPLPARRESAALHSRLPANRFDLASSVEGAQTTSFPYHAPTIGPGQPYQNIRGDDISFPPTHGTYKHQSPADVVPMTRLSPCSSSLAMGSDAVCNRREDTAPLSDPDIDMDAEMVYNPNLYDAEDVIGSRSSTEPAGGKSDEPYAQLIYRAFMSRPNKSMTLQEIYQWFRENTDKAKSTGKGWQNSIRHNLSMNGAFTKRCSNQPALNSDGSLSLDASAADGRKSTEWYLEPRYYEGVQSTTRYRKGNGKSAPGFRAHAHRGDRAVDGNVKAVSGRKGGYQAAHNRKRTKAEQQQEAARQRNQRLQHCGPHFYTDEDGRYYPDYSPQMPPNTSSPYQIQASQSLNRHGGISRGRQSHLNIGYFQSEISGNAHGAHDKTLSIDVDPDAEPTTPPGSGHDSQVDDLSYGNKYQHPFLPGFFSNTDGSFQHPAPVAATTLSPPVYPQQPGYSLHQVEGIFEPPSGIETPLFVSGNSLTGEEAAALMAANSSWANAGPYCG